jgi:DNA-binding transcriptional LysR family regulator
MDRLALFKTFIRVVEAGSFTKVAAELNTTQPTISRQVAMLEEHLGARLFTRTTRALTLTDDGQRFYDQALHVLDAVSDAENAVGARRSRPSGVLRMAMPGVFGRLHIFPRLRSFLARYPDISLDLRMSDGYIDLVEEGVDLAIRSGVVADPGLITRTIGTTRRVAVAAPSYVKARGKPVHPSELTAHDCVVYTRTGADAHWQFESPDGTIAVDVRGPIRCNNSEGIREAVLGGFGIGLVPVWHFTNEIETRRVVVLLDAFEPKRVPINAVYPSRRLVPQRVRVMIDFLAQEFLREPRLTAVRMG